MELDVSPKHRIGSPCSRCGETLRHIDNNNCVACGRIRSREWARKHAAERLDINRDRLRLLRARDPVAHAARLREWRLANPDRVRSYDRKRSDAERRQTPPWADPRLTAALYKEAVRVTRLTGIPHQVDHEIPLQGRNVSGLHVHTNLRVITASENLAKGIRLCSPSSTP